MSAAETAWVAGLLEGEGSFLSWPSGRGGRRTVRISMGTTDLDVLERLRDTVGAGYVKAIKPQHNKLGTKPFWHWHLSARADVRELVLRVHPWLGARRREAAERILALTENLVVQPEGVCMKGHPIIGGNRYGKACRTCIPSASTRASQVHQPSFARCCSRIGACTVMPCSGVTTMSACCAGSGLKCHARAYSS